MSIFDDLTVRIPPSPTGPLHLGTARTALYNYLLAKRHRGHFVLRLEDTDRERSQGEYADEIMRGLRWLGVHWDDGPVRQSEHFARYWMVLRELLANSRAYECYCTPQELDEIRAELRGQGKVEGYDNRHRYLSDDQRQVYRSEGRACVYRLWLPDDTDVIWHDHVHGLMRINTSTLGGDPVIARREGDFLYNFAVVVDDHDSGVNLVVRGDDHLYNTAKQICLYQAMEWEIPEFGHVPLIMSPQREKLSKRKHGDMASIKKYVEQGFVPEAVANYLINMSWQHPEDDTRELFTIPEITPYFELGQLSKSPAVHDEVKLAWFSKEHMQRLSEEEILKRAQPFFKKSGLPLSEYPYEKQLEMVALVKDGLATFSELPPALKVFFREPKLADIPSDLGSPKSGEILRSLLGSLRSRQGELTADDAREIFSEISRTTGVKKGRSLFMPLRLALTGCDHGPDLPNLVAILGIPRLLNRTQKAIDHLQAKRA